MDEQGTSPGTLVDGRFLLRRQIGGGGAAIVWLGEDLQDHSPIAVKLLHPKLRAVDSVLSRLSLEARLLSELDHPNIARAVAFGFDRVQPFIALEYIEGSTLQAEIGARSPLDDHFDFDLLLRLFGQLCSAVEHAHSLGIVHRDLKPANVMLQATENGAVIKVLDFGIAKMIDQHPSAATTKGRTLGSVAFMSPEQARGDLVDHRTDVFALGVILQEMLTLRRVWALGDDGGPVRAYAEPMRMKGPNTAQAMFQRIAEGERPRASILRPTLDPEVDRLIDQALAARPEDRFQSAGALREAADRLFAGKEETLDPTFVRDPTKLHTELRTQMYRPSEPSVTSVPQPEVQTTSPNPAMFTPTPLLPTPHGMTMPKPKRNILGTLLFVGGLAIGVLATLVVVRTSQGPRTVERATGSGPDQAKVTPLSAPSAPRAVRGIAEPNKDPPHLTEPTEAEPAPEASNSRAGLKRPPTPKEPTTSTESPATPDRPAVPWSQLEALLAEGAGSQSKMDELSKRILEHAERVTDENEKKSIKRIIATSPGDPAALASGLRKLRKALE